MMSAGLNGHWTSLDEVSSYLFTRGIKAAPVNKTKNSSKNCLGCIYPTNGSNIERGKSSTFPRNGPKLIRLWFRLLVPISRWGVVIQKLGPVLGAKTSNPEPSLAPNWLSSVLPLSRKMPSP